MSDVIRVQCGSCLATIRANVKYRGKRVKCPNCGEGLQVPGTPSPAQPDMAKPQFAAPPNPAFRQPQQAEQPIFLDDNAFEAEPVDPFAMEDPTVDEYEDYGAPVPQSRHPSPQTGSVRRPRSSVDKRDGLIAVGCGILMVLGSIGWTAWMFAIGVVDFSPIITLIVGIIIIAKGLMGD